MSRNALSFDIQKITRLSNLQLQKPTAPSFHDSHKHSCYIFFAGFDNRLTEGDIITVFSQWGEVVDVNLIRDKETGASRGFGFLAFEDQRSTVLAVDNGNGMRVLGAYIKVDHASNYTTVAAQKD